MKTDADSLTSPILIDADLFISYLTADRLEPYFHKVVERSLNGRLTLLTSSEIYDDIISALRSQHAPLKTIYDFLHDMMIIPHKALPLSVEIAASAIGLYQKHGGRSKLHYFDSFHVATSDHERTPLLTSDRYILDHAREMNMKAIDPRTL